MHASSSSTSSSSSSTAASLTTTKTLPPVPDYAPPPPYPARPSQQYQPELQQQQQPFFTSKPDQPTKQLFHNPFTFPTTGVKVHTDPKSHGLLSYSLPSLQTAAGSVQNDIKQEACGTFRESKLATGILGKSHSDISSISSRKEGETTYALHSDMPCLVPEVSGVKLEISDDCHNHVGEAGKEERRPVVSCHRLVMWPCVLSPWNSVFLTPCLDVEASFESELRVDKTVSCMKTQWGHKKANFSAGSATRRTTVSHTPEAISSPKSLLLGGSTERRDKILTTSDLSGYIAILSY